MRAAVVAVGVVEQRLGRPGLHRPLNVDDGRERAQILRRLKGREPPVVGGLLVGLCLRGPLPEIALGVRGEELPHHRVSHPLLHRVEAVIRPVDLQPPVDRARGQDPDLAQPVFGDAIVQERPIGARHVEHQLRHAVELAARVGLVERDVELHLGAVAVERDRLVPGRSAVQLDGGVAHRLAAEVKDGRMVDDEVGPALERGQIVEFGLHRRPVGVADIHRVGRQRALVEQIRAGRRNRPVGRVLRAGVRRRVGGATTDQRDQRRHRDRCEKSVSPVHPSSSPAGSSASAMPAEASENRRSTADDSTKREPRCRPAVTGNNKERR